MRVIGPQKERREVFGWSEQVGDETWWFLSPQAEVKDRRRPMNSYSTREEAVTAANDKGCRITWLIS